MIFVDDYTTNNYKIADIIKRYGLEKETVFALQFTYKPVKEMIKKLTEQGFNIGSHTITHRKFGKLSKEEKWKEIYNSKLAVENASGKTCEWFIYPYGYFDDELIEMVKKAGYKYGRIVGREGNGEFAQVSLAIEKKEDFLKKEMYQHFIIHWKDLRNYNTWQEFEEFLKWYKEKI